MGGCLDQPKAKKPKAISSNPKPSLDHKLPANRQSIREEESQKEEPTQPKHRRITSNEFLTTYRIQSTLDLSSKMEGPKYLSSIVDGSSKVLRVVTLEDINEKRLQTYKVILGLETFENEDGSIIIIDQYCAGADLCDIIEKAKDGDKTATSKQLHSAFMQIIKIVTDFHKAKTWLGNLNISSFRRVSAFRDQLRLVDFNLQGQVGDHDKMGWAHQNSFEADYEFMGYFLQLILCQQPPIFIPHKIQYVQFESIPCSPLVQKLLRGHPLTPDQLTSIKPDGLIASSKVLNGYKFRRDVNKLLRMRRKRRPHNRRFYGEDTKGIITEGRFQEDAAYRLQTERIFTRIQSYIDQIRTTHQQSFLNYAGNNDSLRKLKEVFLLSDAQKKMGQLKECLATIK